MRLLRIKTYDPVYRPSMEGEDQYGYAVAMTRLPDLKLRDSGKFGRGSGRERQTAEVILVLETDLKVEDVHALADRSDGAGDLAAQISF